MLLKVPTFQQDLTRRLILLSFVSTWSAVAAVPSQLTGHPNRGTVEVIVLLCTSSDSPPAAPSDARAQISGWSGWTTHFQNMFFADSPGRTPGTGSLKNYFSDISQGAMNMTGSVHGWYKVQGNQNCFDAAKDNFYTPPAGAIVVTVLTPWPGGATLGGR